ncbi:MAG TPA: hypothetical protein VF472_08280 [Burkholderiaceae bacterium]
MEVNRSGNRRSAKVPAECFSSTVRAAPTTAMTDIEIQKRQGGNYAG